MEWFHVVDTDNYGGDYPDEGFVSVKKVNSEAGRVRSFPINLTEENAKKLADILNSFNYENHPRFYKVVPHNYVLGGPFVP